jgi:hypothetical protein
MFGKGCDTKKFESPWVNEISFSQSYIDNIKRLPLYQERRNERKKKRKNLR